MSSLFIAGNGFDIAHGIPTKYSDFRTFLIDMFPDALRMRDEVMFLDDFDDIDLYEFAAEILLNTMDKSAVQKYAKQQKSIKNVVYRTYFSYKRKSGQNLLF